MRAWYIAQASAENMDASVGSLCLSAIFSSGEQIAAPTGKSSDLDPSVKMEMPSPMRGEENSRSFLIIIAFKLGLRGKFL